MSTLKRTIRYDRLREHIQSLETYIKALDDIEQVAV